MMDFIDYCKQYVLDNLGEHEGREVYGCDFGYELTEYPNMNGTLTYSRELAMLYLREWWDEASDYWEYEKDNFGVQVHNPFDNPEAYMVCMVIEGVNSLISEAINQMERKHNEEFWNEKFELTPEIIREIEGYVKDNPTDKLF